MSREIVEAMRALASEKGINPDRLIAALEDALLAAYKKQPDSAQYARVVLDPETGDYRVVAEPDTLVTAVHGALAEVAARYDARLLLGKTSAFRPGRPQPTHRYETAL